MAAVEWGAAGGECGWPWSGGCGAILVWRGWAGLGMSALSKRSFGIFARGEFGRRCLKLAVGRGWGVLRGLREVVAEQEGAREALAGFSCLEGLSFAARNGGSCPGEAMCWLGTC